MYLIVKKYISSVLASVIVLMISCSSDPVSGVGDKPREGKLKVASTVTMLSDMVREVGGDRVEVIPLMGPGVDPHLYKPTAKDAITLQKVDVILYIGLMLEGRMGDLFTKMGRKGKAVYAVTEDLPEDKILEPEEFEGHADPHIWGDASLWAECIPLVVKALSESDPEGAEYYQSQGEAYKSKLLELHRWAKDRVATLPEEQRVLVTSHDAFNYLGNAYGFNVVGVQGISTVDEAGLADISKMVDFIKQQKVKAIFVETSVNPAAIERISKDSGAKIGGELFSDAMGTAGQMETGGGETYDVGTYIGMLKHNINIAVEALQ